MSSTPTHVLSSIKKPIKRFLTYFEENVVSIFTQFFKNKYFKRKKENVSRKVLLNFLATFWSRFPSFDLECSIHAASYNFVCLYLPTRKDPRFLFSFHCAITNKARKLLSRNNDVNRLLRKSMTSECEMKARCRHRFVLVCVV